MKPGTLTNPRLWLPLLAIALIVGLASWDQQPTGAGIDKQKSPTDTLPKKKKAVTEKKIRDLDDVIEEMEAIDMQKEMEKVQVELSKTLKELDGEKLKLDIEMAMKEIDFSKMKADIDKALKELDTDKMQKEIQESIAKIDWSKLKKDLEEAKNIDFSKIQEEMKQAQEELKKIKPEIEKELANVKVEMGKAKVELEKAKAEMKEYKEFVDGLDKEGLINKKENYTIRHEDGELTINGKKASTEVYSRYRSFLEKHTKFRIEKSDDDFNIDND